MCGRLRHPFISCPRDLGFKKRRGGIKETSPLNGAIISLRKIPSFENIMIDVAAMTQITWRRLFRVDDKLKVG